MSSKLTLAFVGLTTLVLVATLLLARWSFERGFLDYVNAIEQLRLTRLAELLAEDYRQADRSWQSLDNRSFLHLQLSPEAAPPQFRPPKPPVNHGVDGPPPEPPIANWRGERPPPPKGPPRPPKFMLAATMLLDQQQQFVAGAQLPEDSETIVVPIFLDGQQIGELHAAPKQIFDSPQETAFSRQQLLTSVLIALACLVLAVFASWLLARRLMTPLHAMAAGVAKLSKGEYDTRTHDGRPDELGSLMADIDQLAETLEQSQQARQRWFASVSHELRTPTTVLLGELEAIKDGVRPLNMGQVHSMSQEVGRLKRLIDDLYLLAVSDLGGLRYHFESVDLDELVGNQLQDYQSLAAEKGLQLSYRVSQSLPVNGDAQRLQQLFHNLLSNALAYTDAPGQIQVSLECQQQQALLIVEDSAPSVPAEQCQQLFEALHRQEQSRSRRTAGAGLGLTICHNIAKAHNGSLQAEPSTLGGLKLTLSLPLLSEEFDAS